MTATLTNEETRDQAVRLANDHSLWLREKYGSTPPNPSVVLGSFAVLLAMQAKHQGVDLEQVIERFGDVVRAAYEQVGIEKELEKVQ